jgi:hypothetical protein
MTRPSVPALEIDPVSGPVWPAETQHDAGEHVAQGALQGKTEDYGSNARCRQQTLDREIEDIGDNGKDRGKINETREQVLKQLSLARTALKDDDSAHHADQEPGCPNPPGDL